MLGRKEINMEDIDKILTSLMQDVDGIRQQLSTLSTDIIRISSMPKFIGYISNLNDLSTFTNCREGDFVIYPDTSSIWKYTNNEWIDIEFTKMKVKDNPKSILDTEKIIIDNIKYSVNLLEKTAIVTGHNNESTHINIPEYIKYNSDRLYVTDIDDNAFVNSNIEIVQSHLLIISGSNCFANCRRLQEIYFPKLTTICGNNCFANCINLQKMILPSLTTIHGNSNFENCVKIRALSSNTLNNINGNNNFRYCESIQIITLTSIKLIIGDETFSGCNSLKSCRMDSIIGIEGNKTFYNCVSADNITMLSLAYIFGNNNFTNCKNIKIIDIPRIIRIQGTDTFSNCETLSHINLNSLEIMFSGTFRNCYKITKLIFPSLISVDPKYMFYGCKSLRFISWPVNLDVLNNEWENTFVGCDELNTLKLSGDNTYVSHYSINTNSSLLIRDMFYIYFPRGCDEIKIKQAHKYISTNIKCVPY